MIKITLLIIQALIEILANLVTIIEFLRNLFNV